MKSTTKLLASMGVSLAALMMVPGVSAAQTGAGASASAAPAANGQSSGGLEEVTVTAQRKTQDLQRVPLAVSSFSNKQLLDLQITSTKDLANQVPNMFSSNNVGQGSANVYYIRGLGQTQSFPTFEPQVSTYVDNIYVARQNANNFALFGVDQVQVLRGPQGTLFGRNSVGGAILVTLTKPSEYFGGDASVSYGSYNRFEGRLSVNVPISDEILTRTSLFGIHDDGYVKNLTTNQRLNYKRNWGIREAFRILPASLPNLEWNLSVDYSDSDNANLLNFPTSHGRVSYSGLSIHGGAGSVLVPFITGAKARYGQGADVQSFGATSDLNIKIGKGSLDVITGYRGLIQKSLQDFPDSELGPLIPDDQSPIGQFALPQNLQSSQYSQEVKWDSNFGDKFHYTVGAFALYESNLNDFGAVGNLGGLFGIPYLPLTLGDETTRNTTTSLALYAQGDYKFTDQLTLTVGGRFTHELKNLKASPNTPSGFTTADILLAGYKTQLTTDQFTPHFSLQYQVDPTLMVFGSATRGFQGGGWNGLAFSAATFNNFGPETAWSYDVGFRKETNDHRLRFNATAFYTNVHKYQLLSDNVAAASFVTTNAADMFTYGLEADLTWQPIDPLTLGVNLGLIKSAYFNPSAGVRAQQAACRAAPGLGNASCSSGIVTPTGELAAPVYTPPVNVTVHGQYRIPVGSFSVIPKFSVQYTAREHVGTEGSPISYNKARTLLDLGVTLRPNHQQWSFTAECKNCTRVDYATTYLFGYRYYNLPGVWDVRLSYDY